MPQLSDLIEKRKFVKKSFRPWDLSGTGTVDSQHEIVQTSESASIETTIPQPVALQEKIKIKEEMIIGTPVVTLKEKTDNISGNISGNNQVTSEKHPDNIEVTPLKQLDNIEVTSRQQLGNNPDNITDNANNISYLTDAIKKLSGIQKNIFVYIIHVCTARGALDTGNLLAADLANTSNCTIGSAKTSLNRLIAKYLVIRNQGKACRGGHMVLGITKEIQAAAIQAQQVLFNPLKLLITNNVTGNTIGNNGPYSSSSNKTTTTILPDEWKKIDFESLRKIGFSETQLRQLFDSNTTAPEIVQESINHFSFGLENSDKIKAYHEPLNVFMGVLRKGQMWRESAYVSPKELTLRQILEEKQKKKEQFNAMIKELIELEFPAWRKKLTEEEIKQIVPADILKMNVMAAIHSALRIYFTEKVLFTRLGIEPNG